jgi:hypothetical protein
VSRRSVIAMVCAASLAFAGIGYAATFTLTTKKLGAASVTTPIMFPDQVITANAGPNVGKLEKNDTITFVWSRPIDETTLCSGWSNAQSTHTTNINWTVQNNAGATGNDVLVPSTIATCSGGLNVGSVDLGAAGYVTANANINASPTTVTVGTTTTTLVMKLGANPAGAGKVTTGTAAVWTPDSTVTDLSGHNCGSNLAMTSATNQF